MKQQEAFGRLLRDLRSERGLSQKQVADLLYVSRKTVGNWELGNRMPDIAMLSRLADCLDVESYVLLDALRQPAEPPRIMVVEDIPVILKGLLRTISTEIAGVEVCGFRTAKEALAYASTIRVSVAFLDIELSGESGIDLAKNLREIQSHTNIIFLTCHPEYTPVAVENHCSGYILKPLTPEKLRRELNNLRFPVRGLKV